MAESVTIAGLERWDQRIRERAAAFGLDWFPQEFELCDHLDMLGAMAYSGMPAHYPHWSYGKSYEKTKTLYDYGVSGLPYEMVINSNPSIAYLMSGNSLCLQILTIAHVYGHNDFFKNNFTFCHTEPEHRLARIKRNAERVRSYIEDPSIGIDAVEHVLDAAHALAHQRRRNIAIHKLSGPEQEDRARRRAAPAADPFAAIHAPAAVVEADLEKIPLEPEEDLLLVIRDYNPKLEAWQKDLLTIVHDEAGYFIPQIETKIINEGWATFWHREILNALELPPELHLEFLVHHNQVVRPAKGEINPYHLGLRLWDEINKRHGGDTADADTRAALMAIREVDRDSSFLRRFLSEELMRDMDLFTFGKAQDKLVVRQVSDADNWRQVKDTMIANVGTGSIPVIKVRDIDYRGNRVLHLSHEHDGRDLRLDYAEHTLSLLHRLWMRNVVLDTEIDGKRQQLSFGADGFASEAPKSEADLFTA